MCFHAHADNGLARFFWEERLRKQDHGAVADKMPRITYISSFPERSYGYASDDDVLGTAAFFHDLLYPRASQNVKSTLVHMTDAAGPTRAVFYVLDEASAEDTFEPEAPVSIGALLPRVASRQPELAAAA